MAEEAVFLWLLLLDDGCGFLPAAKEAMFSGRLLNNGSGLRLVTREERHVDVLNWRFGVRIDIGASVLAMLQICK